MTIYRKHDKGIWTGMEIYDKNKKTIDLIDDYNKFLNYTYDEQFSNIHKLIACKLDNRYLENYDIIIIDDVFPTP